jgi:hypothetical protein
MDAGSNDSSTVQVKEEASKPENRRKLKEFGQRFMKKRQPRRGPRPMGGGCRRCSGAAGSHPRANQRFSCQYAQYAPRTGDVPHYA